MPKRTRIGGQYNIAPEIAREAERLGLDAMATGGNNDFIFKALGKNEDGSERFAILGAGGTSGSPDRLAEKSDILIILNDNWTEQVAMSVQSAREAMILMSRMFDPYKG